MLKPHHVVNVRIPRWGKESVKEKKNGEIDLVILESIIEGMESRLRKDLNEIRAEIKKITKR